MKMVHGQLGTHIKPDIKTWNTILSFCLSEEKNEQQQEEEKKEKEKNQISQRVLELMERLGVQGDDITEEKKKALLLQRLGRAAAK